MNELQEKLARRRKWEESHPGSPLLPDVEIKPTTPAPPQSFIPKIPLPQRAPPLAPGGRGGSFRAPDSWVKEEFKKDTTPSTRPPLTPSGSLRELSALFERPSALTEYQTSSTRSVNSRDTNDSPRSRISTGSTPRSNSNASLEKRPSLSLARELSNALDDASTLVIPLKKLDFNEVAAKEDAEGNSVSTPRRVPPPLPKSHPSKTLKLPRATSEEDGTPTSHKSIPHPSRPAPFLSEHQKSLSNRKSHPPPPPAPPKSHPPAPPAPMVEKLEIRTPPLVAAQQANGSHKRLSLRKPPAPPPTSFINNVESADPHKNKISLETSLDFNARTPLKLSEAPPTSPLVIDNKASPPKKRPTMQRTVSSKTFMKAMDEMSHLRPLLVKFYEIYNREKLSEIDRILGTYGVTGGEEQLNEALRHEYGTDLKSIDVLSNSISTGSEEINEISAKLDDIKEEELMTTQLVFAKALFAFQAQQEGDLDFECGQVIEVTDTSRDWWVGSYKNENGKEKKGEFPKNYVELVSESLVLNQRAMLESTKEQGSFMEPIQVQLSTSMSSSEEVATEYSPELVKDDICITHYFKSVLEMVTSEFKYVTDLYLANYCFVLSFNKRFGESKASDFFPAWLNILGTHENVLLDLIGTLPDVSKMSQDFGRNEIENSFSSISPAAAAIQKKISHTIDVSDVNYLNRIAGEKGPILKSYANKLDLLEDTYSKLLESGVFLSPNQRTERTALISEWVIQMTGVFVKLTPYLKCSNQFIINYPRAQEALEKFDGDDLEFLRKLEQDPILRGLKLRDFLIKPVQRVCKYPLLYREIIKYAPEEETKVIATQAQNKLMVITDNVNTMIKQNESGNAKKLQEILAIIRPESDVSKYGLNETTCQLRRDGDLSVVSFSASPTAPEGKVTSNIVAGISSKSLKGILFTDQLVIAEKSQKFLTKQERLRIVHSLKFNTNWESIEMQKSENDSEAFSITFTHAQSGPAKGATLCYQMKVSTAARDGWVEDLEEISQRMEAAKKRESEAQKQEQKRKSQQLQRTGSMDWEAALRVAPRPPKRGEKGSSLVEELKALQALQGRIRNNV